MPNTDIEILKQAVLRAGRRVQELAAHGFETHIKSDRTPVTTADLESNRILREDLLGAFPDDGWLSEETPDDPNRLQKTRVWVVDPIDGTKYFMKGVPQYTISVALVEGHAPRAAVVYNPATQQLFSAVRGAGAWLGKEPVAGSGWMGATGEEPGAAGSGRGGAMGKEPGAGSGWVGEKGEEPGAGSRRVGEIAWWNHRRLAIRKTDGPRPTILVSPPARERGRFDAITTLADCIPMGSIAYTLALVAGGEADGVINPDLLNEWDIAAGVLLIEEAGGAVVNGQGHRIRFNQPRTAVHGLLASLPERQPQMRALVGLLSPRRSSPAAHPPR